MATLADLEQFAAAITKQLAALGNAPLQAGSGTLTNGVSPAIAARVVSTSRIVVTRQAPNGSTALGTLSADTADRTLGSSGSFVVRSLSAAGAAVSGDQSSFDWVVIG